VPGPLWFPWCFVLFVCRRYKICSVAVTSLLLIWNPQFGFRPHLIFGHLREIVTVIESRTTRGKGLSRIGASNRCSALARAVAGGAMPPTSGAQSGRLGGIASAAARNSRALHAAPRVTPVRVVERSQGKRQKIAAAT
jgi:hypothetical protein